MPAGQRLSHCKAFPQVSLRRNPAPDPRLEAALAAGGAAADLPPGSRALFVGRAYYGCAATVLPPASAGFSRKVSSFFRAKVIKTFA